nr:hypothetical protein [uncultured Roseovarius sp.]
MTTCLTRSAPIFAALLSPLVAVADPLPCHGNYQAISGEVTLSGGGMVMVDPSRWLLNFEVVPVINPDGFDVFAQILELETGNYLAQREAQVTGTGDAALAAAVQGGAAQLA